ncbi:hypothetical protein LTR56_022862 [Elasticomyces elasticus]|nr:hypothetical protein LTR56_022862 [Elasticomyces elasticus]KAK3657022.1 hypothetical protein LTR22_009523 [Elasticomyces elasticus]KAK4916245.1 hypothetical protein LTR49_015750 [Elasticomyces elasticus]KAK5764218.1 hypothetical protein LTS12_005669 [Elasticomyces elasticus]
MCMKHVETLKATPCIKETTTSTLPMLARVLPSWRSRGDVLCVRLGGQWQAGSRVRRFNGSTRDGESRNTEEEHAIGPENAQQLRSPAKLLMGVVTTDNAQRTSIAQLLASISPKDFNESSDADTEPDNGTASLTLLLTPGYAQHAVWGAVYRPLLDALRVTGEDTLPKPMDVVIAVVDRLPSDNDHAYGEEGLAYIFKRNAPPLTVTSQTPLKKDTQKPGSIGFQLSAVPKRPFDYMIQLPLAQTVFSTGKTSTLVHTHYNYDRAEGHVMDKHQYLEAQMMSLPLQAEHGAVAVEVPLIPLTPLRIIRSSMGNIVRTLSSKIGLEESRDYPEQSEPQPASKELEASVTSYFKALAMSPEAVNVWALILPNPNKSYARMRQEGFAVRALRHLKPEDLPATWISQEAQALKGLNSAVVRLLRNGARMHRVLSGGGGWGKKAGLLSLDPDSVYSSRELRADAGWEFDFDDESVDAVEKQQKKALGEIVNEGESIMFFIAPRDTDRFAESRAKAWSFIERADMAAIFGAVPSTIDTAPEQSADEVDAGAEPRIQHRPNFFGALSEGGLALSMIKDLDLHTADQIPDSTQTKFDVPFSHVRITESAADIDTRTTAKERLARLTPLNQGAPKVRRVNVDSGLETTRGPHGSDIKLYQGQRREYSTQRRFGLPLLPRTVEGADDTAHAGE